MTKPYGVEELKARVRAALRRASAKPSEKSHLLRFDDDQLVIDPPAHTVTVRGEPVDLTPTEYKLLLYLAYNAGQVLTFEQILDNVWGAGYEDSVTNIKYYVSSLRQKIEADPRQPCYILTTRGVGYCLADI
jgi:two-component system KDP operon response regulator KdpE